MRTTNRIAVVTICLLLTTTLLVPGLHGHHADASPALQDMALPGERGAIMKEMKDAADKLSMLAEVMNQEQYGWRPMEGVRSTSEVYMHVAATNYMLARVLGTEVPEDVDYRNLEKVTDKAAVMNSMKASFDHFYGVVRSMKDEELASPIRFFGQDSTRRAVVLHALTHAHEHLGQSIAYARANHVVPPWSR